MLKIDPRPDYLIEEGHYASCNDGAPAAVCIILEWDRGANIKEFV